MSKTNKNNKFSLSAITKFVIDPIRNTKIKIGLATKTQKLFTTVLILALSTVGLYSSMSLYNTFSDQFTTKASAANLITGSSPKGGNNNVVIKKEYYVNGVSVKPATIQPGQTVRTTIRAYNEGSYPITEATINDSLPVGFSFVPGTFGSCSFDKVGLLNEDLGQCNPGNSGASGNQAFANLTSTGISPYANPSITDTNRDDESAKTSGTLAMSKKSFYMNKCNKLILPNTVEVQYISFNLSQNCSDLGSGVNGGLVGNGSQYGGTKYYFGGNSLDKQYYRTMRCFSSTTNTTFYLLTILPSASVNSISNTSTPATNADCANPAGEAYGGTFSGGTANSNSYKLDESTYKAKYLDEILCFNSRLGIKQTRYGFFLHGATNDNPWSLQSVTQAECDANFPDQPVGDFAGVNATNSSKKSIDLYSGDPLSSQTVFAYDMVASPTITVPQDLGTDVSLTSTIQTGYNPISNPGAKYETTGDLQIRATNLYTPSNSGVVPKFDFSVSKVAQIGYGNEVSVNSSEEFIVKMDSSNNGDLTGNNASLNLTLPQGFSFVPNSFNNCEANGTNCAPLNTNPVILDNSTTSIKIDPRYNIYNTGTNIANVINSSTTGVSNNAGSLEINQNQQSVSSCYTEYLGVPIVDEFFFGNGCASYYGGLGYDPAKSTTFDTKKFNKSYIVFAKCTYGDGTNSLEVFPKTYFKGGEYYRLYEENYASTGNSSFGVTCPNTDPRLPATYTLQSTPTPSNNISRVDGRRYVHINKCFYQNNTTNAVKQIINTPTFNDALDISNTPTSTRTCPAAPAGSTLVTTPGFWESKNYTIDLFTDSYGLGGNTPVSSNKSLTFKVKAPASYSQNAFDLTASLQGSNFTTIQDTVRVKTNFSAPKDITVTDLLNGTCIPVVTTSGTSLTQCDFPLLAGNYNNYQLPLTPIKTQVTGATGLSDDCTIVDNLLSTAHITCLNVPTVGVPVGSTTAFTTLGATPTAPVIITPVAPVPITTANLTSAGVCTPPSVILGGTTTCKFALTGSTNNLYSITSPIQGKVQLSTGVGTNCIVNTLTLTTSELECASIPTAGATVGNAVPVGLVATPAIIPLTTSIDILPIPPTPITTADLTPSPTCTPATGIVGYSAVCNATFTANKTGSITFESSIGNCTTPALTITDTTKSCAITTTGAGSTTPVTVTAKATGTNLTLSAGTITAIPVAPTPITTTNLATSGTCTPASIVSGNTTTCTYPLTGSANNSYSISSPIKGQVTGATGSGLDCTIDNTVPTAPLLSCTGIPTTGAVVGPTVAVTLTATPAITTPATTVTITAIPPVAITTADLTPAPTCTPATGTIGYTVTCTGNFPANKTGSITFESPYGNCTTPALTITDTTKSCSITTTGTGSTTAVPVTAKATGTNLLTSAGTVTANPIASSSVQSSSVVSSSILSSSTNSSSVQSSSVNSSSVSSSTNSSSAQSSSSVSSSAVSSSANTNTNSSTPSVPVSYTFGTATPINVTTGSTFPVINFSPVGNIPSANLPLSVNLTIGVQGTSNYAVIPGQINSSGQFVTSSPVPALYSGTYMATITTAASSPVVTPANVQISVSIPAGTKTLGTPTGPVTGQIGTTLFPAINLTGCDLTASPVNAQFLATNTSTPITGSITQSGANCVFTPNPSTQVIPSTITSTGLVSNGGILTTPGSANNGAVVSTNFTSPVVTTTPTLGGPTTITSSSPLAVTEGNVLPPIQLSGCNVTTGTTGTFTPAGSSTVISGVYTNNGNGNCTFTPNASPAPIIPVDATNGPSTLSVLTVIGGQPISVPTNFSPAGVVLTLGILASSSNPAQGVINGVLQPINLVGSTYSGPAQFVPQVPNGVTATPILGTISGNVFTPTSGQTIQTQALSGNATGVLSVPSIGSILPLNVATNFTVNSIVVVVTTSSSSNTNSSTGNVAVSSSSTTTNNVSSTTTANSSVTASSTTTTVSSSAPVTTTNPVTVITNSQLPNLPLPTNCGISNGTRTTATLPGSTLIINGTITNCVFVPDANSTVPSNISTNTGGTATVVNPNGGTIAVPINPIIGATNPNPNISTGTPTSTATGQAITSTNPLVLTTGQQAPTITLAGCGITTANTPASVILPGTTTAIAGTINGCVFTPNANQPIPTNVTLGNGGTATVVIPGVGNVNVPINTIAGAGTTNNPGTPINPVNNQPATGANPISGVTGGTIAPITLTGGNVVSGTPATFTCQGSNTVINGTITNNQFVTSSGTYPVNANLGNTLCTISVTGGPSVNVPVVLTAPAGSTNNPGTPVNPVNNQPVTTSNPVTAVIGSSVPSIPFTGGNVPAGTQATLFLPGSSTPIQGTINANGQFVPNSGQVIPSDVTVGSGNSRIVINNGPTINVPTTITPRSTAVTTTTTSSSATPVNNINLPLTGTNNNTNGSGTTQTTGASNNPTTVSTNPNGIDPVTGNPINGANNGALTRSGLAGTGIGNFANPAEYFNQPSQALKTPLPTAMDEDKGPNNGDGNYDGIKDSTQDNVVTIPTALGNSFVTAVFTGEGECSKPEQFMMKKETEQTKIDSSFDYIYGLVDFKVKCSKTTTLKTYWHGLNSFQNNSFTYRKLGNKTPGVETSKEYFNITPTLGSESLGSKQLATATYSVTDGEFGDDTAKDGIIIDPSGPALDPQSVSAFLPSTARTGGDTIIKLLIPAIALMTILTLAYSRRRRVQESDLDIE